MFPGQPPGTARPARLAQDLRIRARDRPHVPAAAHPRVRLHEPRAPAGSDTCPATARRPRTARRMPTRCPTRARPRQWAHQPLRNSYLFRLNYQQWTQPTRSTSSTATPWPTMNWSGRHRFTQTSTKWTSAPSNPLSRLRRCHRCPLSNLLRNLSVAQRPSSKPSRFPGTSHFTLKLDLRPLKILGADPSSRR